jgi:phosphatidate phosphatase
MGTSNEYFSGQESKSKMSFVSGHASLSWQSATFIILYLQAIFVSRNKSRRFHLVIPFFQVVAAMFAYFTSLSRVMDYQHHPGDVIGKTNHIF